MSQNVVFSAKKFSSKFFLDSKNAVLTTTRLVKVSQTPSFFPKVRKRSKILWVLRKNCFSSNVPQDTVNALWTLLTLSLLLRWKLPSARSPKRWQICIFFSKIVFPQNIAWTQEIPLWQPLQIIREVRFFSQLKVRKNGKNSTFFSKSIFFRVFCGHKKCSFGFSAEIVSLKTELLFGSKWKATRSNVSYSRKTVFSENVIRTRTKQFWHFWRQSFCCNHFFFCPNSKNGQNCMLFSKTIFPQSVCWTKKALVKTLPNFSMLESSFWSKPEKDGKNQKSDFRSESFSRLRERSFEFPGV